MNVFGDRPSCLLRLAFQGSDDTRHVKAKHKLPDLLGLSKAKYDLVA